MMEAGQEDAPPGRDGPSPGSPWLSGLWFGLLAGGVELAVDAAYWAIRPRVTVASIRTNRHHLWMVPTSDLVVVGAAGLLFTLGARLSPKLVARIGPTVLAALAALTVIWSVDRLHPNSGIILACGLGALGGPGDRAMARRIPPAGPADPAGRPGRPPRLDRLSGQPGDRRRGPRLAGLPAARPGSPNVLLLVMDNVRADALSLYGAPRDTSPNLARIASRGLKFNEARSAASWTLPSHASLLTGRWPHELSVTVDSPLDDARPTLAETLAARGYVTAGFVGNTYYCNGWYGLDRGFSRYEDFAANVEVSPVETIRAGSLGEWIVGRFHIMAKEWPGDPRTRKTADDINTSFLSWLDARNGRPFFAFLNYYDAHEPFQPPPGDPRQFGLSRLPEADRAAILKAYAHLAKKKPGEPRPNEAEVVAKAAELLRDSYSDCIASLDRRIGSLIDELERRGVLDDTLVVITSDHGEEFGERSLFGHGVSVYRPEVHVPLIVLEPGRSRRTGEVSRPVSLRDFPATVAGAVGLGEASPFPGDSLATARNDDRPSPILSEVEHQTKFSPSPSIPASLGPITSIADGPMVYIRNADGREELFDRRTDPAEVRDVAGASGSTTTLARFRDALGAIQGQAREPQTAGRAAEGRVVR